MVRLSSLWGGVSSENFCRLFILPAFMDHFQAMPKSWLFWINHSVGPLNIYTIYHRIFT